MSKKLNWALVGLGQQAEKIADGMNAAGHKLTAVFSNDKDRLKLFRKKYKAERTYDSFNYLLGQPDIEAVFIASPTYSHYSQALAAIKAQKNVFCEKPMCLSASDALKITKAVKRHNVKFAVGFHLRQHPLFREIKKTLSQGLLGELRLMETHWSTGRLGEINFPPLPAYMKWREIKKQSGGGAIMARGTHLIDLFHFLTERNIDEAACFSDNPKQTDKLVTVIGKSGAMLISLITGRQIPQALNHLTIYGSHGRIRAVEPFSADGTGELEIITEKKVINKKFSKKINLYQKEIEAFADYLAGYGPGALVDENDGLKSVAITEACLESMEKEKFIRIDS